MVTIVIKILSILAFIIFLFVILQWMNFNMVWILRGSAVYYLCVLLFSQCVDVYQYKKEEFIRKNIRSDN